MAGRRNPSSRNGRLVPPDGIIGCLSLPSPPPSGKTRTAPNRGGGGGGEAPAAAVAHLAGAAPPDWEAVAQLASKGLTREEIAFMLGLALPLDLALLEAFDRAFARGRALGSAEIKQARYRAALEGKVSAQSRLLEEFRGPAGGEGTAAEAVTVEREIIGAGETED